MKKDIDTKVNKADMEWKADLARLAELEKKVSFYNTTLDNRVTSLEDRLKHIPDFAKLLERIENTENKNHILEMKCEDMRNSIEAMRKDFEEKINHEKARINIID